MEQEYLGLSSKCSGWGLNKEWLSKPKFWYCTHSFEPSSHASYAFLQITSLPLLPNKWTLLQTKHSMFFSREFSAIYTKLAAMILNNSRLRVAFFLMEHASCSYRHRPSPTDYNVGSLCLEIRRQLIASLCQSVYESLQSVRPSQLTSHGATCAIALQENAVTQKLSVLLAQALTNCNYSQLVPGRTKIQHDHLPTTVLTWLSRSRHPTFTRMCLRPKLCSSFLIQPFSTEYMNILTGYPENPLYWSVLSLCSFHQWRSIL